MSTQVLRLHSQSQSVLYLVESGHFLVIDSCFLSLSDRFVTSFHSFENWHPCIAQKEVSRGCGLGERVRVNRSWPQTKPLWLLRDTENNSLLNWLSFEKKDRTLYYLPSYPLKHLFSPFIFVHMRYLSWLSFLKQIPVNLNSLTEILVWLSLKVLTGSLRSPC